MQFLSGLVGAVIGGLMWTNGRRFSRAFDWPDDPR